MIRRLRQVILIVYGCFLVISVGLVGAAGANDAQIAAHTGRALARVTHVSLLRTTVEFQDQEGTYQVPPNGVLYPTGLREGQRVWVLYDTSRPQLVKVQGREWTLSIIPAGSIAVVASIVAGLAWWGTGRMARQPQAPVF